MSKAFLKGVVAEFLKSPEPEVLCIRGKWGTGKTYSWDEWLVDATTSREIGLKKYSYCSLFGLNTLPEVWSRIFENTINIEEGKPPAAPSMSTFDKFVSNTAKPLYKKGKNQARKKLTLATEAGSKLPWVGGVFKAVENASTLWIKDQIICFDDMERKGAKLDVGDILGLASHLAEERNCKVVLILNDEKIEKEEDKEDFRTYLEKVVDISALFDPTVEECVQLGVTDDTAVGRLVAEHATKLQIKNIRVVQRIKRLSDKLEPVLRGRNERVLRHAIRTLTVTGWVEFCEGAPPREFMDQYFAGALSRALRAGRTEDGEETADTLEKQHWITLLRDVGVAEYSELDVVLSRGVRNGYFDEELTTDFADLTERRMKENDTRQAISEAWDAYHGAFALDIEAVLKNFEEVVRKNVNDLEVADFDDVVSTIREMGSAERATSLVKFIIENRTPTIEKLSPEIGRRGASIKDEELHNALAEKATSLPDDRPIEQVIQKGIERRWAAHDVERMKNARPEEFRALFMKLSYAEREKLIPSLVRSEKLPQSVGETVIAVLKAFYDESPLNRERLREYKSLLDPDSVPH